MEERSRLWRWIAFGLFGLVAGGCATNPLPPLRATPSQACGDRCSAINCPVAYRCNVDANCVPHCEGEQLGNHP
jgi:hypothetical protein